MCGAGTHARVPKANLVFGIRPGVNDRGHECPRHRNSRPESGFTLLADIFIPEVGMIPDELAHERDTGGIVENREFDATLTE